MTRRARLAGGALTVASRVTVITAESVTTSRVTAHAQLVTKVSSARLPVTEASLVSDVPTPVTVIAAAVRAVIM